MLLVAFLGHQKLINTKNKDIYKYIALVVTGIQMLLAFFFYAKFDSTMSVVQSPFTVQLDWIPSFNIQYYIGVDGLSMPMVILAAMLSFFYVLLLVGM